MWDDSTGGLTVPDSHRRERRSVTRKATRSWGRSERLGRAAGWTSAQPEPTNGHTDSRNGSGSSH